MANNIYSIPRSGKSSEDAVSLFWDLRELGMNPDDLSLGGLLAALIILRWVDFQDAEGEAMAAFDESDYTPALPVSLQWRSWCDRLRDAAAHGSQSDQLRAIFESDIPAVVRQTSGKSPNPLLPLLERNLPIIEELAMLDVWALRRLSAWLADQPFETSSDRLRLLASFDVFLDSCGSRATGERRTPASVCELLVALADLQPGESLYDPCFGFGGVLTTACAAISNGSANSRARSNGSPLQISGVEISSSAYTIGLARVLLAGAERPCLERGNSLERQTAENPRRDGFDVVICHPPWGLKIKQPGLEHFPVQTTDSTALFLQHAIGQLKPNGRALVVIPKSTIFRQQKFAPLRDWIASNCHLETVIALPDGVFRPWSGIGASVLVLRKSTAPQATIRVINPAKLFQPTKQKAITLSRDLIKTLVAEARAREPGEYSIDLPTTSLDYLDENAKATISAESGLMDVLALVGKGAPVVSIKNVCRVSAGRSVASKYLLEEPDAEGAVPFIRIANLQHGQTTRPTSWVHPAKAAELGPRYRLRAAEVLVSKTGTIGKAGVVRNGAVNGIASASLFVLSPDTTRIDPSYLVAYIQSKPCQAWLASKASGQVIQGLKKEFIEEMPILMPPLSVQEQVALAAREHGEDPIKNLAEILSPADANPLSRWIDGSLRALEGEPDADDPSRLVRFNIFGTTMYGATVDNQRIEEVGGLALWAKAMFDVDHVFRDSEQVPKGSALYGICQEGIAGLRAAKSLIKGNSLLESRAAELTDQCIKRLEATAFSMEEGQPEPLSCTVLTNEIEAGRVNILSCRIVNRGILPLRSVAISMEGFEGGYSGFLAENTEIACTFSIEVPSDAQNLTGKLRSQWTSMGGISELRENDIVFRVVPAGSVLTDAKSNLGPSPYFVSEPVTPQRREMFIGREEVIDQITRQLVSGNTVLLEGNRRAGKSSILKQIEGVGHIPGKLAVYSSLQASEGDKHVAGMRSEAVWRRLANDLAKGLASLGCDVPLPDGGILPSGKGVGISRACRKGISAEAPWEDFLEYAGVVVELLCERELGLVLMIDEFDKLQEGIDNGITSPQIPENIRYLIQNLRGFSAILTGSRRMQRLRHEYWSALYGLGSRVGVTALAKEAAERLVRQPVKGKLYYSPEAVEMLIALCAQQPFLIQSMANLVFVEAATSGIHAITTKMVDDAAQRFVEDNEHFASLMDYTESDRRRFLVMLVHQAEKDPDPITLGTLQQRLVREEILLTDSELTGDLRFLMDLELINFHGEREDTYSLSVPLMGRWLDYQHDYRALLAKAKAEQESTL